MRNKLDTNNIIALQLFVFVAFANLNLAASRLIQDTRDNTNTVTVRQKRM